MSSKVYGFTARGIVQAEEFRTLINRKTAFAGRGTTRQVQPEPKSGAYLERDWDEFSFSFDRL